MWNMKEQRQEQNPLQEKAYANVQKENLFKKSGPEFREKSTSPVAVIGPAIQIKGELTGSEDLFIDGTVDGKIELDQHQITIGPDGHIKADISAKRITIKGKVQGNIKAQEMVVIKESGKLWGDIITPRIAISEGAFFTGSIEMGVSVSAAMQKTLSKERPQPAQAIAEKSLQL